MNKVARGLLREPRPNPQTVGQPLTATVRVPVPQPATLTARSVSVKRVGYGGSVAALRARPKPLTATAFAVGLRRSPSETVTDSAVRVLGSATVAPLIGSADPSPRRQQMY